MLLLVSMACTKNNSGPNTGTNFEPGNYTFSISSDHPIYNPALSIETPLGVNVINSVKWDGMHTSGIVSISTTQPYLFVKYSGQIIEVNSPLELNFLRL